MRHRGVIAAGHPLTTQAGADVLRNGGNAVDAAIAAVAMACVCEPVLSSPGGGGFAMIRHNGLVSLVDSFAHSPQQRSPTARVEAVHVDFGTTHQEFRIGPGTAATPGLFAGLEVVARRFGTELLPTLVIAAVDAARNGVTITPFQHHVFDVLGAIATATESARHLFIIDGDLMPVGELFRPTGLADALEILASDGVANSEVGAAMIAQQEGRGHLTANDLVDYRVVERQPLEVELPQRRVLLNPLPAAGGLLVGHTLRALEGVSPVELAAALDSTVHARRQASGDLAALAEQPIRQRGTTHVSVVDGDGTACAITTSNGEGNGEVVDGFDFMLNNMLGEDDVNPSGDQWPLDTRLSSMMCPTIIEGDGGDVTALGTGGSSRIPSAISQVVARVCIGKRTLHDAVVAPRLHADAGHLDVEPIDDAAALDSLLRKFPDHRVWPSPHLFFGGVHSVRLGADGRLDGVGDPRRDGSAIVVDG
ncbi:MAG: gamma-glutamyltransferase [Actinomycetota bacterium]